MIFAKVLPQKKYFRPWIVSVMLIFVLSYGTVHTQYFSFGFMGLLIDIFYSFFWYLLDIFDPIDATVVPDEELRDYFSKWYKLGTSLTLTCVYILVSLVVYIFGLWIYRGFVKRNAN